MGIEPRSINERINFWQNHIAPFTTNAVAIGTTTAAVTDLGTKATAARAAYVAQTQAMQAMKSATADLKTAMIAMSTAGMAIVDQIRGKARLSGDVVYNLADIPVPATPSAKGNPGTPNQFKLQLLEDGTLIIKWKCANPTGTTGTIYQVERRIGATGPFEALGGSGKKEFADAEIPLGATSVTYQIRAVRSTAIGNPAMLTVSFGTNSAGMTFATLADAESMKRAA